MAGQPITRKRMEKIEEAGEDRVFDLWLELKSVKKVMQAIGFEDEEVSSAHRAFYRWVKLDEDRKQRWDELREVGGHAAAEEIADVVDSATVENTNLARLRVDHLKWRAESLNKGYGKQQGNNVTVNVTAQNAWLGALSEDLLLELGAVPPAGLLLGFIHGVHLFAWWTPSLPLRPIPSRWDGRALTARRPTARSTARAAPYRLGHFSRLLAVEVPCVRSL